MVLPNDHSAMFGVRIKLCGLVKREDLNGKIAWVGSWLHDQGRYRVFLTELGSNQSLSVKPVNLCIASATKEELQRSREVSKRSPLP